MLETVDLGRKLAKADYKNRIPQLREELRVLQYRAKEAALPVVIVFEGWDAAGKGLLISRLLERLDPRGFKVHPARPPTELEQAKPFLWRFWIRLPARGEIALFDRSWYGRVLIERVARMVPSPVWKRAFEEIREFERQLADDGAVIIKFFLHISKGEQRRRLVRLEKDPLERWRVTKWDWKHHSDYDKYVVAVEEMLAKTDSEVAPWTVVEATDRRHAEVKVFETLTRAVRERLGAPYGPKEPRHKSKEAGRARTR